MTGEETPINGGSTMGITDKITGRVKKAAGDLSDDASLRREGRTEERKGEAKSCPTPKSAPTPRPTRSRTWSARASAQVEPTLQRRRALRVRRVVNGNGALRRGCGVPRRALGRVC